MTTIAYRRGVVAADSMASSGDTKSKTTKLFLLPKLIVGCCGHLGFGLIFVDWLRAGAREAKRPSWKGTIADVSFSAIVLSRNGCVVWDEYLRPMPLEDEFTAIGSGADVALGAMHMGATAYQAVEAAIRFNAFTGGKVVSYGLRHLKAVK